MTDTRERFLRDITDRVPTDRIAELHLFRPLRRGGTETGIAVIAADGAGLAPSSGPTADDREGAVDADDTPYAPDPDDPRDEPAATVHSDRHTVFTARYRLTLKGSERGKWEFDVVADADAPLDTVDTVVRGVQRRAGDDEEPERLTSDGVRAALDGTSWRATT